MMPFQNWHMLKRNPSVFTFGSRIVISFISHLLFHLLPNCPSPEKCVQSNRPKLGAKTTTCKRISKPNRKNEPTSWPKSFGRKASVRWGQNCDLSFFGGPFVACELVDFLLFFDLHVLGATWTGHWILKGWKGQQNHPICQDRWISLPKAGYSWSVQNAWRPPKKVSGILIGILPNMW